MVEYYNEIHCDCCGRYIAQSEECKKTQLFCVNCGSSIRVTIKPDGSRQTSVYPKHLLKKKHDDDVMPN